MSFNHAVGIALSGILSLILVLIVLALTSAVEDILSFMFLVLGICAASAAIAWFIILI